MASTNILPFAPEGSVDGGDLFSSSDYSNSAGRKKGYSVGYADRRLINTALKQCALMAAGVAQWAVNNGQTVLDTSTVADVAAALSKIASSGVSMTVTSTSADYPILCTYTPNRTANGSEGARFSTAVKINPGTGALTASAVYNAVWNDYAEFFPRGEATEAGDIIALDTSSSVERYVKATEGCRCPVGVHSDTFGHLIGGDVPPEGTDFMEYNVPNYIPVGLVGRVRVKFKGRAEMGVRVVPSEIPGVGRAYKEGDSVQSILGFLVEADHVESDSEVRRLKMKLQGF